MTHEQAVKELARLCQALGKTPNDLTEGQAAAWLEALRSLPYERGRLAVTAVYHTWDRPSFPPPGALNRQAREVTFEGQPNAAAYSQNNRGIPWHRSEEAQFAFWRQQQIEAMGDEAYWRYLHDTDFRRYQDTEWQAQWQRRGMRAV